MNKYFGFTFVCMKTLYINPFILLRGCTNPKVEKRIVQPTNGYAQMVVIEQGNVKTLHISGQIGQGEDLEMQMRD